MQIIIDADACPKAVKEIVFRAAERAKLNLTVVANTKIRMPYNPLFKSIIVPANFNEADDKIVELVSPEDLVITADIPLADRVIKKGALALDPRGYLYDENNIGTKLAMRDLMHELRENGFEGGGPDEFKPKDRERFANSLQKIISGAVRKVQ
ncbi:MAG: YaiI/YqxD family protein [Fibrobacter sp.]|nr:YaiI/YqxD family protein [Fibrobacter sp.]